MKLSEVTRALYSLAPLELAESWDNVGLLCGDPQQSVKNILVTIDLTRAVLNEAIQIKSDLIMAYHPTIWNGLKQIVPGQGSDGPPGLIYELIRHRIGVYSMHTALDLADGGINDALANALDICTPKPLLQRDPISNRQYKLIVFMPESDLTPVSEAIFAAGGGIITPYSNYSKCSFYTSGTGSFLCGSCSTPTIGQPGSHEKVREYRFETVVPADKLSTVLKAMLAAHSYEEPAFDVLPMIQDQSTIGLGRWGRLNTPIKLDQLIDKVKQKLKIKHIGIIGQSHKLIHSAAVAAGSCGSAFSQAVQNQCDLYLTGEISHHDALKIQESGMIGLIVNHSNSERFYLPILAKKMRRLMSDVHITISRKDHDPIRWT